MQVDSERRPDVVLEQILAEAFPDRRGVEAWGAFLHAHAALMRHLATSMVEQTGLTIGDFDVLGQLAYAGGELRMTDLAARAFSSRANMTRRIDRLVEEGLVRRAKAGDDARSVVVVLTDVGLARFVEVAPRHLQEVAGLFVAPLTDEELATFERVLARITPSCSFG